jgi:magnesium-transporting ATPase (P-type)
MTEESGVAPSHRPEDTINLGSLFRSSATIMFVVQIVAVIAMIGALAAYFIGDVYFALAEDMQILALLLTSIVVLVIFLAAISAFVRFSRRIGDAVVGPGIEEVRMNTPRVKGVVVLYALLVLLMAITGIYIWYLVDARILAPWAATAGSLSLRVFGLALGALFISLLVQVIIAVVGRSATKVIIEVLDGDDSEFLD